MSYVTWTLLLFRDCLRRRKRCSRVDADIFGDLVPCLNLRTRRWLHYPCLVFAHFHRHRAGMCDHWFQFLDIIYFLSSGPAYLDENVSPKSSPIYLGIWFAMSMFGPGLGFLVGSNFLRVYTDIKQVRLSQSISPISSVKIIGHDVYLERVRYWFNFIFHLHLLCITLCNISYFEVCMYACMYVCMTR